MGNLAKPKVGKCDPTFSKATAIKERVKPKALYSHCPGSETQRFRGEREVPKIEEVLFLSLFHLLHFAIT